MAKASVVLAEDQVSMSRPPHGSSQPSANTVPAKPKPFSVLCRHQTHMVHRATRRGRTQTHLKIS